MKKQSRKDALRARADRFADNANPYDTHGKAEMSMAYVAGYRAAMRDLRKELKRNTVGMSDMTLRIVTRSRTMRWLRPLR